METVKGDIIKIAGTVEISLLVPHYLFEEAITTSLTLLFLQEKIVCRGNLVMLIVLNIRYSLCQIAVWTDPRRVEAVLDLAEKLLDDWNSVLTDNNTFQFLRFDVAVPLVVPNVSDSESFDWISIEHLFNKFF